MSGQSKVVFCSDSHFFHKNIVKFTNRSVDTTQEEHDEWLVNLWNKEVAPGDLVYHLGDFSFAKNVDQTIAIIRRLNGVKHFIKGNHDSSDTLKKMQKDNDVIWHQYLERNFNVDSANQTICMFHFPISSWHKQGHGSWHLHGHCVDLQTEILTKTGWKKREQIVEGEKIISFDINTQTLVDDEVLSIIDIDYSGKVISCDSKSSDFRFTEDHVMLVKKYKKTSIVNKIKAHELLNRGRTVLLTSAIKNNKGLNLSKEHLQLYIVITADGNVKQETNLCRIRIKKDHKIKFVENLLRKSNISFNRYESKEYSSFNFYIPNEILHLPSKGLTDDLISLVNENESAWIFEAYANSDGHLPKNSNTLIIYSAKEKEIDILQAIFCQNGYHTNKYSRQHGFSTNLQHQLSVTKKSSTAINSKKVKETDVLNEPFWCVKTNNQSWVMRRNGVVQITGNCHGNHADNKGKMLDVGLDSAYNIFGKHKFFTLKDIAAIMYEKQTYISDHHKEIKE